jgi:nicotinate-nucleotide adenylyltransferase
MTNRGAGMTNRGAGMANGLRMAAVLSDIEDDLRRELSPRRWKHVKSVARWAQRLAKIHGANPAKAYLAGILHDCAKEFSAKKLKRIAQKNGLARRERPVIAESRRWGLLHAYVSAWRAQKEWGVNDAGVLSAVRSHTLGREKMNTLDQILYVADYSSPDRWYREAAKIRPVARKDLRAAVRETVRCKIMDVLANHGMVHPQTVHLWNVLCKPK